MAIYKDKKRGTWYFDFKYHDENGKYRGKTMRGFKTKREAQEAEWNFRNNMSAEPSTNTTFIKVFESYLSSRQLSYKSLNRYNRFFTLFFSLIANKKLSRINDKTFLDITSKIIKSSYSTAYKNGAIIFLRTLLMHSNDYFNTSYKPRLLKTLPKKSIDHQERPVWTKEQFSEFIQHVDNPVYHAFFTFLFNTGARLGEARAVLKENITDDKKVKLHYQIRQSSMGLVEMKTPSSRRTILLDDYTYNLVTFLDYEGPYAFGGEYPLSNSSITRIFKEALSKTDLPKIRLHDLRHSHATHLINNGANVLAVSKRLGHSSTAMTLQVYAHLLTKTEDDLVKLL